LERGCGQRGRAESLLQRVLRTHEEDRGLLHPDTLNAAWNYMVFCYEINNTEKSVKLYQKYMIRLMQLDPKTLTPNLVRVRQGFIDAAAEDLR
jgi:hypothetical protein